MVLRLRTIDPPHEPNNNVPWPKVPQQRSTSDTSTAVTTLVVLVTVIIVGISWPSAAYWISAMVLILAFFAFPTGKNPNDLRTQERLAGVMAAAVLLAVVAWFSSGKKLETAKSDQRAIASATKHRKRTRLRQLERDKANATVSLLLENARKDLRYGFVDLAMKKLEKAKRVPHSTSPGRATHLESQIKEATDLDSLQTSLVNLTDREFQAVKTGKRVPPTLSSRFDLLGDETARKLIAQVLNKVQGERDSIRKRELAALARKREEEKALAEARRREEQDRRRESARAPTSLSSPVVKYRVMADKTYDIPLKSQVTLSIVVEEEVDESRLRSLLQSLVADIRKRTGFKYRDHANVIGVYAYGPNNYRDGALWIGMAIYNENLDTKLHIDISHTRLTAAFEGPTEKHGLSKQRRKQVFWDLALAEDEAFPALQAGDTKKYEQLLKECKRRVMRKVTLQPSAMDGVCRLRIKVRI